MFLPRGGSAVRSEDYSLEKGVKENEMPKTERRGWEFLGWFDQAEGGNKYTSIAAQSGSDKKKITLYAHWKAYDYKLAYVTMVELFLLMPKRHTPWQRLLHCLLQRENIMICRMVHRE